MDNSKSTPKAHLYDKVDNTRKDLSFLVFTLKGNKYQVSLKDLKLLIKDEAKFKELEDKISNISLSKEMLSNVFKDDEVIKFNGIFNILHNRSVEKLIDTVGSIYTDGNIVRIRMKDKWKTLKIEE